MNSWFRHHRMALGSAVRKLTAQKSAALASILAIGIAISLPLAGYVLLEPLRGLLGRVALEPQLTVFMKQSARRGEAEALGRTLRGDPRIESARFITKEAALRELASVEGMADVVSVLASNPLPDAYVVRARDTAPEPMEHLAGELRALPGVERVQTDSLWARRLASIAAIGRLALMILATLLGFGLVAVTFNTIRLQILTLRDEIEVSKLLGATDGYIRRPYYYLGLLQGAIGGSVALAIVWVGIYVMNMEVRLLADSYGSNFRLAFPPVADALSVILYAGLLGWLGAHLSVARHLRDIEPT
jgi:cell division transport system permease protein